MAYPDAVIYEFSEQGIEAVNYEDTPHVSVTRNFLLNREGMLEKLLAPRFHEKGNSSSLPLYFLNKREMYS